MSSIRYVYMIRDRETGEHVSVYSRAYHDEWEFSSEEHALNANCHGIHKDKTKFAIEKWKVTRERVK